MIEDSLQPKIELLQEQIQNLEQSGFFTEKEMDRLAGPLRIELEIYKRGYEYDSTGKQIERLRFAIEELFIAIKNKIKKIFNTEK